MFEWNMKWQNEGRKPVFEVYTQLQCLKAYARISQYNCDLCPKYKGYFQVKTMSSADLEKSSKALQVDLFQEVCAVRPFAIDQRFQRWNCQIKADQVNIADVFLINTVIFWVLCEILCFPLGHEKMFPQDTNACSSPHFHSKIDYATVLWLWAYEFLGHTRSSGGLK